MKLALIGKGNGKELAPLKGKGIVTWGVNDIVAHRDVDVCFFMDAHLLFGSQMEEFIIKSVEKTDTPVYCIEKFDHIPTSIVYPLEEIKQAFGTDYFADSFSYMLALAIYDGYREFDIYGFNYAFGEKYITEKPCVSYWLGVASGLGCTLNLYGDHCGLLKTADAKLYSYGTDQTLPRTGIRIQDFKPEEKTVAFSVKDRFTIVPMIPFKGSYDEMKFAQKLHKELSFTPEDNKQLNIRSVEDKNSGRPTIIWDDNDLPDKEVELNKSEVALISSWLLRLNKDGLLTFNNLKTYEKFCN